MSESRETEATFRKSVPEGEKGERERERERDHVQLSQPSQLL